MSVLIFLPDNSAVPYEITRNAVTVPIKKQGKINNAAGK